jgi:hypothetical protein
VAVAPVDDTLQEYLTMFRGPLPEHIVTALTAILASTTTTLTFWTRRYCCTPGKLSRSYRLRTQLDARSLVSLRHLFSFMCQHCFNTRKCSALPCWLRPSGTNAS